MKNLLLLVPFSFFMAQVLGQNTIFSPDSTYLALAKKETFEKPVFIYFYADWCEPCKRMNETSFNDSTNVQYLKSNYISIKVDVETEFGEKMFGRFAPNFLPYYAFFKDTATVLHQANSYKDASEFLELIQIALDTNQNMYGLLQKYTRGEKGEYLKKLAYYYLDIAANKKAQQIAKFYLTYNPEWHTSDNLTLIKDITKSIDFIAIPYIYKNQEIFKAHFGKEYIGNLEEKVIVKDLAQRFPNIYTNKQIRDSLITFLNALPPAFDKNKIIAATTIVQVKKDDNDSLMCRLICEYMQTYTISYPVMLNNYASDIAEKSTKQRELLLAIGWVLKALETTDNYAFNDTAALLYFKTNNKAKAKEYAEKAIKIAEKDGGNASTTKELLEKINLLK